MQVGALLGAYSISIEQPESKNWELEKQLNAITHENVNLNLEQQH